ncbi:MMPL family transporter [Sphaerotilaceae bacterium SBD11-9]
MKAWLARLGAFAQRRALVLWLACVAAALAVTVRTHYVADLSAFLPSSPSAEQAVLLDQLRTGVAARLVLIGIEGGTREARIEASRKLGQALRKHDEAFEAVHNGDNAQFEATGKFLFEHRYLLSPAIDAQRFTPEGLRAAIDESTALLGTPAGGFIKSVILRDPTGESVRMAESMLPSGGPRSDGGVWVSRHAERAVLIATTRADGADLDAQERALKLVRDTFAALGVPGVQMVVTGSGTFAVSSRAQIKTEVEHLAIAGGVAIIGILLLAFGGSLRTLLSAMLPVACGVLAGIAAVSLAFGNVHGITLGFGTTLIGEAVDYAIYYLIQARSAPGSPKGSGARHWITDSWPTVRLGLWTSVCGFAALLFSGFPGLAQLGLFSVAGLTAAALTTRCVFPQLAPDGAPGTGLRRHLGRFVGWCTAVLPRARWPLMAVAVAAAVALAWLPSAWRGNLSSLSPVGAKMMALDADLRADVGATEAGTLVAVSAPDEAGVLARAEAAGARLDKLVEAGVINGYESPARVLPSPARQQQRQAALPDAATLTASLEQATVDGPLPARRLGGFVDDVQAARQQPLLTMAALKGTPLAPVLAAQLVAGDGTRPWRALLSVQVGPEGADLGKLRATLADLPGTQVVNIGDELAGLYSRYLHEALLQALLGALAVCLLLAAYLRDWRRLLRLAQPIVAAVLIVLAVMSARGVPLGILHLVGLLLTVAIGSNYALFFDQIRAQQDAQPAGADTVIDNDTLASLALANLTAVVSFCLLAFSSIPALFAVGQLVAPGILLSLLLSAAFIPRRKR